MTCRALINGRQKKINRPNFAKHFFAALQCLPCHIISGRRMHEHYVGRFNTDLFGTDMLEQIDPINVAMHEDYTF